MKDIELIHRLRFYLQRVMVFVLRIVAALIVGSLLQKVHTFLGATVLAMGLTLIYLRLHYEIGRYLIYGTQSRIIMYTLPIVLASILVLVYKMMVNSDLNKSYSCLDKISAEAELLNYFGFSLWSSIFLWEVYFFLNKGRMKTIEIRR